MLTKRIIPCLDVKDGRVVKGVSFVNLRDAGDPVEVATVYDREGADELCFLDITASHENRKTIIDVVEQTAAQVFMPLTVGGGVRTLGDIRALLKAGADKVSINTAAVQRPEFVKEAAERFGAQCIVVAIDAKRRKRGVLHCRREATGDRVAKQEDRCGHFASPCKSVKKSGYEMATQSASSIVVGPDATSAATASAIAMR